MTPPAVHQGRGVFLCESDAPRPTRVITKRECDDARVADLPTLAELLAATAFARRRGDHRRADLYMTTAVRRLLRKQREARRS